MKKFSFILFVAVAAIIGISTTGCGDDTPEPTTKTTTDTTATDTMEVIMLENEVRVGLEEFDIVENMSRTESVYRSATASTLISVFGEDEINGLIEFQIEFKGFRTGTYISSQTGDNGLTFGLATGEGNRRVEYSAQNSQLTVIVTEYGAVGERVKGTFTGQVMNTTGNTVNINNGVFEVIRGEDL